MGIRRRLERWLFWFPWYRRRAREADLARELDAHLELEAEEQRATGLSPEEAAHAARRALGNTLRIEEDVRAAWGFQWVEMFLLDLRYGLRMLCKSPGLTAVALITLALGIGANTAIFSVVDAVLLKPLPYQGASRMVFVREALSGEGFLTGLSRPDFLDLRGQSGAFGRMGAFSTVSVYLRRGGRPPRRARGAFVSSAVFRLFGVKPILGRTFGNADEEPGGPRVIVVSNRFWRSSLHCDPRVIGRAVTLYGLFWAGPGRYVSRTRQFFTIIGVLPADFRFPGPKIDVFLPFGQQPAGDLTSRGYHGETAVANLRTGVSLEQAQSQSNAVMRRLGREYPQSDGNIKLVLTPMLRELVGGRARKELILLLGVSGLVLLLACANVAHMALASGVGRQREFAVRAALGAGRVRLAGQLLVEQTMLALLAGVVGAALAVVSVQSLVRLYPQHVFRLDRAHVSGGVLLFALGVSFAAAVLFGLAPMFEAQRAQLGSSLKEGGCGVTESRGGAVRSALFVAEVALALIVFVGAGLLLRSLSLAMDVNPGFRPNHLFELTLGSENLIQHPNGGKGHSLAKAMSFYRECLRRVRGLPGVESVSAAISAPVSGIRWESPISGISWESQYAAGAAPPGDGAPWAAIDVVVPGYFRTIGARLVAGRFFSESGKGASRPVAIVDETMAHAISRLGRVVGRRIYLKYAHPSQVEIIGVVGDVKQGSLVTPEMPEVYIPARQEPLAFIASPTVVVRTRVNPASLELPAVRAVHDVDKTELVTRTRTLDAAMASGLSTQRFLVLQLGLFSGLALVLTVVGVSSAMAYMVAQRTHEIGLRMALGAQPGDVSRLVIRRGSVLTGIGIALGVVGALAVTRLLRSELFEVKPTDPATFSVVALLIAVVALVACWIPARRAARIDPVVALRQE